jgi:vacuolar-type H+-ATPase subunit E/Vma4
VEEVNRSLGYRLSFGGVLEGQSGRGLLLRKGGVTVDLSFRTLLEDFFRSNERDVLLALFQGVEA